jgi:amino acid transporter
MASETGGLTQAIKPRDVGLKREIGLIGATWASETSIIGSGWLFGSFFAAQAIGGAAVLAWIIAGIAIIILALVHAELGGMYPVAGGTARFPHLAYGAGAGISFGFFSWLQAVTVAPIEAYAVIRYAHYFWPSIYDPNASGGAGNATHIGFVVEIILMAIFTAVNFIAIKQLNYIFSAVTWWKVAIPVITIIILFTKFNSANFSAGGGFFPSGTGAKELFGAIPGAGIIFAYLGFEQADQLAAEIKRPQRNLPLAIIIAVLLGTAIYVLLQVVFIGAVPHDLVSGPKGFAGIPATNEVAIAPFAGLAALVGLSAWASILRADAFISPAGTGAIYVTGTSRVSYGLARNRYFPGIFGKVDKRGVPWFGMIIAFVFGLVFTFPFPSWHSLVALVTSASVLMYAGAPLAMGAFRLRLPGADRPYRQPGGVVVAPLAFVVANLIIYWTGFETQWKLGVAIVIGYVMILMYRADRPGISQINWARSAWIGAYLLGMGVLSWQGDYGPGNTGRLTYPWDILVVALFSLAIYYWAVYSSLSTTEMEERIAAQSAPAAEAGTEEAPQAAA